MGLYNWSKPPPDAGRMEWSMGTYDRVLLGQFGVESYGSTMGMSINMSMNYVIMFSAQYPEEAGPKLRKTSYI